MVATLNPGDDPSIVSYEVIDQIAWVSFNRPTKRNAISPNLNRRMKQVLDELEFHDDVRVVVLRGEGAAWCAGMDLQEYFRDSAAKGIAGTRFAQREAYSWFRQLRWYEKPTIAMVHGWAFGGAYSPLFACDIAIAADEAQFGLSEINWGILPGGGVTKVAMELMPFRKAMYHAMMGKNLSGKEAEAQGLVTESVPLAQLEERVREIADELRAKNPGALKATKHACRRVLEMTYDNAEEYLIKAQEAADSYDPDARQEGMRQFLDEKTYKPGLGTYDTSKQKA